MRRPTLWAFALLLATPLTSEPLDQHGGSQPWRGSEGAYTVLDFAASWCTPCWRTLPKLEAFALDHQQFKVIVVSVDDEETGRTRLVDELSLSLPVLWDGDYEIAEFFQPEALPATLVLNPDGDVIYRHIGSTEAGWRSLIAHLKALPDPAAVVQ